MATDLIVLGPSRDQAKSCQATGNAASLLALYNDRRCIAWVGFGRVFSMGQLDAKVLLDPLAVLSWCEVGTHKQSSKRVLIEPAKFQFNLTICQIALDYDPSYNSVMKLESS
jgi:hypothetical protein